MKHRAVLFLAALMIAAPSFAQHTLQIDDGLGHYSWLVASNPGGTYILPPGGGTLLTGLNIGGSAWILAGNTLSGGSSITPNEFMGSTNNYDVVMKANNVELLRLVSGGGVTMPSTALSIGGVAYSWPASQAASSGYVLSNDGAGNLSWASTAATAWQLLGNTGTTAGTNFIGTTDNQAFEIHVFDGDAANQGSKRVVRYEPNLLSANIIGGYQGNSIGGNFNPSGDIIAGGGVSGSVNSITSNGTNANWDFVGGGAANAITDATGAAIAGGIGNEISGGFPTATADSSFIGGGVGNDIYYSTGSVIGGGNSNAINGINSGGSYDNTIGGGTNNIMWFTENAQLYTLNTIGGGGSNTINSIQSPVSSSSISGGAGNSVTDASFAVIAGGSGNLVNANSSSSAIGGGTSNSVNGGSSSTIAGGSSNGIGTSDVAVISGGANNSIGNNSGASAIGGGNSNSVGANSVNSTISGGVLNSIAGNVNNATVGGGSGNGVTSGSNYATVAGGQSNSSTNVYATVGGGIGNTSSGAGSVVGGGGWNQSAGSSAPNSAGGDASTIGGGILNSAQGAGSYIGGGGYDGTTASGNTASGNASAIVGGVGNSVSGTYSAIAGGRGLTLSGNGSFGYLGGNSGSNDMSVVAANTSVFGNTDLWLANNDNTASTLYFYAPNSTTGAFPGTTKYVGFKAGVVGTSVVWTLPLADGATGSTLTTDGAGNLSWLGSAVSGSGTVNTIPKWTPTGTQLGNSLLSDNGTAVSSGGAILPTATATFDLGSATKRWENILLIGALDHSPNGDNPLDNSFISGHGVAGGGLNYQVSSDGYAAVFSNTAAATSDGIQIAVNTNDGSSRALTITNGSNFNPTGGSGNRNESFYISDNGMTFIGNLPASASTTVVTSNGGVLESRAMSSLVAATSWALGGNSAPTSNIFGTLDNTSIDIRTNNSNRMFIDGTNGRIGIGTVTPVSELSNTTDNNLGSDGHGISTSSLDWATTGTTGYVASFTNEASGGAQAHDGVSVKVYDNTSNTEAFDVSQGGSTAAGTLLFGVKGNGDVSIATTSGNVSIGNGSGTVAVNNLPASSSTTVVTSNGGVLESRSFASLVTPAWALAGNALSGSEVFGSTNAQDVVMEANGATQMTLLSAGGVNIPAIASIGTQAADPASPSADTRLRLLSTSGNNNTWDYGVVSNGDLGYVESRYDNYGIWLDADNNVGTASETFTINRGSDHTAGTQVFKVDGTGAGTFAGTLKIGSIPTLSASNNILTTNGGAVESRTVTSIVGASAWALGGNIAPSSNIFGTLDNTALDIRTNNTTQLLISGAGDVTQTYSNNNNAGAYTAYTLNATNTNGATSGNTAITGLSVTATEGAGGDDDAIGAAFTANGSTTGTPVAVAARFNASGANAGFNHAIQITGGDLDMGGNTISNVTHINNNSGSHTIDIDGDADLNNHNLSNVGYVTINTTGGAKISSISGTDGVVINDFLDMNTHKIVGVVNPTSPQDAATKNYVDNAVGGTWSLSGNALAGTEVFGSTNAQDVVMQAGATTQMTLLNSGGIGIPTTTGNVGVIFQNGNQYIHSAGDPSNFFAGQQAGNLTLTAAQPGNTGIGYQALNANTTGSNNVAVGSKALLNSVVGDNVAIGAEAMLGNIGVLATNGSGNVAVGRQALMSSTNGDRNVAVGIQAMLHNQGSDNTVVGAFAMGPTSASVNNAAFGKGALDQNTGNDNTAVGYEAGHTNVAGASNTFLGYQADANGDYTNATAIGANAVVGASNSLVLGNGANVGIGTSTPSQKLEVQNGHVLISNSDNTARELRFAEPSTSGSNYTAFKAQAQSGDVTYTLPAADGSSGSMLTTDGSGNLSWSGSSNSSKSSAGSWMEDNVPQGNTNTTMTVDHQANHSEIVQVYSGSVVGISIASDAALVNQANNTISAEVTINGAGTGLIVTIDGTTANNQYNFAAQAAGLDTFNAGDRIGIRYTSSAVLNPNNGAHITCTAIVEY